MPFAERLRRYPQRATAIAVQSGGLTAYWKMTIVTADGVCVE